MNACALTDHGNLFGAIEFYHECKAAGINPIIGYEAYVAPGKRTEREAPAARRGRLPPDAAGPEPHRLQEPHQAGVRRLSGRLSLRPAHRQGTARSTQRRADLPVAAARRASSASSSSRTRWTEAKQARRLVRQVFGKHFYIEIQNNGLEIQRLCAEGAIDIANRLGLPLVATSDAHYLTPGRSAAHDVLLCINTGRTAQRRQPHALRQRPVLRPAAGGDVRALPEPCRRRATQSGDRRRLRHRARFQEAAFPGFHAAGGQDAGGIPTRAVRRRPDASATGGNPSQAVRDAARARTRHHLPHGLRQLLPHRVGLRPLRGRERHSVQRPRLGVRCAGQLSC